LRADGATLRVELQSYAPIAIGNTVTVAMEHKRWEIACATQLFSAAPAHLHVTSSQADATMSPAVKAHLCGLAKRDAAFTPAEIGAMDRARVECIASLAPRGSGPAATTCKAEGASKGVR